LNYHGFKIYMNLYLPVEVKNRELYSKVLLAKYAAEKGFNVILGKKNDLNRIVLHMPAGVYFGLGVPDNYENFYRSLVELGNIVVVCEEEGLITYTDDMYLDMRISSKTMQYVDFLFSWGVENQNLISSNKKELSHKIKISGHPRFDLLKPEFSNVYNNEIAIIREKYNKYVLICTCFSSSNHFVPGIDYVQSLIDKKVLKSKESIDKFKRYQKIKTKTLRSFLEAIPLLAKTCPETDIVVRPHPSENKEIYVKIANEFSNVHVESNFSVHPWILSAEALVHHYCATSVEAYAADVPRFCLRPEADPLSEKDIPFECSKVCSSPDELVKAVNDCLVDSSYKNHCVTPVKDYSDYVLNISDVVASKLLVKEISSIVKRRQEKHKNSIKNNNRWYDEYIGRFLFVLRDIAAMVIRRNNVWRDYTSHKFDKFTVDEIRELLSAFSTDEKGRVKCKMKGSKFIQISMRG
jgi:surface carbohydrate biosynthesis protein